jgi:hypothetical protein
VFLLKWTLKRYDGRKHVYWLNIAQVLMAEGGVGVEGPEPVTVFVFK